MKIKSELYLYAAFAISLLGMVGSLYFSDVLGYPPCKLCWYQRIAMYPLVPVLFAAIKLRERKAALYSLPLAIAGWVVALYHNLIFYDAMRNNGQTSLNIVDCGTGVPCTDLQLMWFGFISIPLLSLVGFTVIIVSLWLYHKKENTD